MGSVAGSHFWQWPQMTFPLIWQYEQFRQSVCLQCSGSEPQPAGSSSSSSSSSLELVAYRASPPANRRTRVGFQKISVLASRTERAVLAKLAVRRARFAAQRASQIIARLAHQADSGFRVSDQAAVTEQVKLIFRRVEIQIYTRFFAGDWNQLPRMPSCTLQT